MKSTLTRSRTCLTESDNFSIDEDFAKAIAKDEPLRIVFKDNGFASDTSKVNVQQLLKELSPSTEMKVI